MTPGLLADLTKRGNLDHWTGVRSALGGPPLGEGLLGDAPASTGRGPAALAVWSGLCVTSRCDATGRDGGDAMSSSSHGHGLYIWRAAPGSIVESRPL